MKNWWLISCLLFLSGCSCSFTTGGNLTCIEGKSYYCFKETGYCKPETSRVDGEHFSCKSIKPVEVVK